MSVVEGGLALLVVGHAYDDPIFISGVLADEACVWSPIGAVIVKNGRMLFLGVEVLGERNFDRVREIIDLHFEDFPP